MPSLAVIPAVIGLLHAIVGRRRPPDISDDLEAKHEPPRPISNIPQGSVKEDGNVEAMEAMEAELEEEEEEEEAETDNARDQAKEPLKPQGIPLEERTQTQLSTMTSDFSQHEQGWSRWFHLKPQKSGVRMGRTFTSTSSWSQATTASRWELPWLRKVKDFIFQTGPQANEKEVIPQYRWTPIFSGVSIPFSILLEIPGLTAHWYIRTEANRTVEVKPNPKLLDAGMGISMASAVIANAALVARFLEHRPKELTLLAIVMLTIHDIINTVSTIVFAVQRRFNDGFTYGQPFWMTVASTSVSLLTNGTLIYDYISTPDFSKSGSGLTRKQRSLVIIVIILLGWIAFGAAVYSTLLSLSFIDGLYFTVVSIETIGFGDFHPMNTGSRVFCIFYNTLGILNLGMAVSTCRETIIESFEHSYFKRLKKIKERRHHRHESKIRKTVIERTLREAGLPVYEEIFADGSNSQTGSGRGDGGHRKRGKHVLNFRALSADQMSRVAEDVDIILKAESHHVKEKAPGSEFEANETILSQEALTSYNGTQELLDTFGHSGHFVAIEKEQRREFMIKLSTAWGLFLLFWLIGGIIFMRTEGWSYGIALYFCFVTFSTIGYGDFAPETPAGRSIFVLWALLGVGTMTILFSVLSEAYSSKYHSVMKNKNFNIAVRNFRRKETAAHPSPEPPFDRDDQDKEKPAPTSQDKSTTLVNQPIFSNSDNSVDSCRGDVALARQLQKQAAALQSHALYFLGARSETPPESLVNLLNEILAAGNFNGSGTIARRRKEILGDEDGRKLLFMISLEKSIRCMLLAAEKSASTPNKNPVLTAASSLEDIAGLASQPNQTPRVLFSGQNRGNIQREIARRKDPDKS